MMAKIKDVFGTVGGTTANYASRIGCHTSALARRVGPKRGGIALGVLAAVIGVPMLIRYFKHRNEALDAELDSDLEERELERGVIKRRRRMPRRAHVTAP